MPPPPTPPPVVAALDATGKLVLSGPISLPAGSASVPSIGLGTSYGWFAETVAGLPAWVFVTTGLRRTVMFWDYGIKVPGTCEVAWSDTDGIADKPETGLSLRRDENNRLSQRNADHPQAFSPYNNYIDPTHFERADLGWVSNAFFITTHTLGGTARDLVLGADGEEMVRFKPGHALGFFGVAPMVKQLSAALTNNVEPGGIDEVVDDFADNDWTALRAAVYQLARKAKEQGDLLRAYGLAG